MKRITKFIAIVASLLIFLTSCQMRDTSWVFAYGEERMPAGAYILLVNNAFSRGHDILLNEWWELAEEYPEQEREPSISQLLQEGRLDEVFNLQIEGVRLYDWVLAEAQAQARQHFAVSYLMAEHGIEADPSDMLMALLEAQAAYAMDEEFFRSIGVVETSMVYIHISTTNLFALFEGLYSRGGPYEIPEAELIAYFFAGQELIFPKEIPELTGEKTEEEMAQVQQAAREANEELRELAQEFLERLQDGEAFELLQYELALMFSPNPDAVERQRPGAFDFLAMKDSPIHNQATLDGLNILSVGNAGIFEDDWVIAVVRRLDTSAVMAAMNEQAMDDQIENLIWTTRFEDYFLPMIEELANTLPIDVNNAALNRYTLSVLTNR